MKKIRIEEVGDINSDYPYLEVFFEDQTNPFLEIAISDNRELFFKFYVLESDIELNVEEFRFILSTAENFLPKALKNEDDFLGFVNNIE